MPGTEYSCSSEFNTMNGNLSGLKQGCCNIGILLSSLKASFWKLPRVSKPEKRDRGASETPGEEGAEWWSMTTDTKVHLPLLGLSRSADKPTLQATPLEAKLKMGVLPSHCVCTFIWGCHPHLSQCCETFSKKNSSLELLGAYKLGKAADVPVSNGEIGRIPLKPSKAVHTCNPTTERPRQEDLSPQPARTV